MTIQNFHKEFKITLDKSDSSAYPEFLDGEIDFFINEEISRLVKQRYGKNNIYQTSWEETQKRTEDLKTLVCSKYALLSPVTEYVEMGLNVVRADLNNLYNESSLSTLASEKYMFYGKSLSEIGSESCAKTVRNVLIQQDDLTSMMIDPFNKPTKDKNLIFFENGDIYVWLAPGKNLTKFLVTFIKKPAIVNIGTYGGTLTECDLSEHLHKEIVQGAVAIALESIESPRTQSHNGVNVQKVE